MGPDLHNTPQSLHSDGRCCGAQARVRRVLHLLDVKTDQKEHYGLVRRFYVTAVGALKAKLLTCGTTAGLHSDD